MFMLASSVQCCGNACCESVTSPEFLGWLVRTYKASQLTADERRKKRSKNGLRRPEPTRPRSEARDLGWCGVFNVDPDVLSLFILQEYSATGGSKHASLGLPL